MNTASSVPASTYRYPVGRYDAPGGAWVEYKASSHAEALAHASKLLIPTGGTAEMRKLEIWNVGHYLPVALVNEPSPAPVVAPVAEPAPSAMGWGGAYAQALAAKVAAVKVSDLDAFTRAYIDAALWTEEESLKQDASKHEAEYEPATRWDVNVHCIAPDALVKIVADCAKFQSENETPDYGPVRAGHDFWLTRNGHGCGFRDREELTNDQQCLLTKAAKAFGESDLYFGDDGLLYVA